MFCFRKILFLGLLVTVSLTAFAQDDLKLYKQGIKSSANSRFDAAFLHFNLLSQRFPESGLKPDALFAVGEYYFSQNNLTQAKNFFNRINEQFPDSKGRIFALAYLFVIADKEQDILLAQEIRKTIIKLQAIRLIFSDYKEYGYFSGMSNDYRAFYYIDKIEIHLAGKLFTTIKLSEQYE